MRRILVVDDELAVANALVHVLAKAGWTPTRSLSFTDGLAALKRDTFEVVLADLELRSKKTGLDLLKEMPERNRPAKFFILTGYGTQDRCRDAFLAGVADFLDKPIQPQLLLAAIGGADSVELNFPSGELIASNFEDLPAVPIWLRHVKTAFREIERRHTQIDLTVAMVANSVGVSTEHLCRLFARHAGHSPLGHLHDTRVRAAETLLARTDLPVKIVARNCGYHSSGELLVHFRRRKGLSPTEFRATQIPG